MENNEKRTSNDDNIIDTAINSNSNNHSNDKDHKNSSKEENSTLNRKIVVSSAINNTNKLAPILTFSSTSDEPDDDLRLVHSRDTNTRNNNITIRSGIDDKRLSIEDEFRGEQMKSMISRSCMTSRETSDLENHLTALNNFDINFQSLGQHQHQHGSRLAATHENKPKRNALVIGEAYINWDNEPNMDFIDASMSTMNNVASATLPPSMFNHTSSFEPRMILRLDSGGTAKVTLESGGTSIGANINSSSNSNNKLHGRKIYHHHHQVQSSRVTVKGNEVNSKSGAGDGLGSSGSAADGIARESVICENVIEDEIFYDEPITVREQWTRKTEFLLAIIGFSVDLGNIWRFPKVVYENGGGKFLVPYFIQLALCGLPLFYMELALGQFHHTGLFTLWEKLCPMFKGLAFTAVIIDLFMAMFYNTIIAWSVYYLFVSFKRDLMWKDCNREWNTLCCLPIKTPPYANLTLDSVEYQKSGPDSFVYRIFKQNTAPIRNRIVIFNTSNQSTDFLEGVRHVYESLNMSFIMPSNLKHVPSYESKCVKNYSCEYEEWMQSYHVVSNGTLVDAPKTDLDKALLAEYVHNPTKLTDFIEGVIKAEYASSGPNVDIILNCGKSYMNNPTEEFFNRFLTQMHLSTGLEKLGGFNWILMGCLFLVFVTVYFALWKGIKSAGKAVWITATAPYLVMFVLLIRGLTLPGSMKGVSFYLTVDDWSDLLKLDIWVNAATQIFFSLGPGFGTIIALSSYNKTSNNCYKDALVTSFINCLTSILSGFVVFSTLGHMTHVQGKPMPNITEVGPGLIFIAYPQAISLMPWAPFWAVLFFFMLFTLGIDSTFGGLEAVITGVCDAFPTTIGKRRSLFVFALIVFCFVGALPTVTFGGPYIVQLLDTYTVAPSILIVVFFEIIGVMYVYGCDRFCDDIYSMIGSRPNIFWVTCWKYISPAIIITMATIVCVNMLAGPLEYGKYVYSGIGEVLAALIVIVPVSFIPIYAIYRINKTPGTFKERIKKLMKPKESKMTSRRRSTPTKENGDGSMNLDNMYNSRCVIINNQKDSSKNSVPL